MSHPPVEASNCSDRSSDGRHGHAGTNSGTNTPEQRRKPWNRTLEAEGSIPFSSTDFADLHGCLEPPERFKDQSFRGGPTGEIPRAVRA